jgi:hypothetical protein
LSIETYLNRGREGGRKEGVMEETKDHPSDKEGRNKGEGTMEP